VQVVFGSGTLGMHNPPAHTPLSQSLGSVHCEPASERAGAASGVELGEPSPEGDPAADIDPSPDIEPAKDVEPSINAEPAADVEPPACVAPPVCVVPPPL
jgi:hypothetical protein